MGDETFPSTGAPHHLGAAGQQMGSAVAEAWKAAAGVALPLAALARLQADYIAQASDLWNKAVSRAPSDGEADTGAKKKTLEDRRFAHEAWNANPALAYLAQIYLLNARTLMQMAEAFEGDEKTRQRIRFAVQQWVDAASPSNYLALNPEAQHMAMQTGGASIAQGLAQLWHDIKRGQLSQTDESVFEVGRNIATTEGSVVFENELFQLLEYKALTPTVHERPLLMVPPCINKYYILDLQPDNSLIRYAVQQGHRVFVVSWRNPDESLAKTTWDDYIEHGAIRAIDAVQDITGAKTISTLGFCVGGTILATALAVLKARGRSPAGSMTLLTTFLDFSETGVLNVFVDEATVRLRELTIGADSPHRGGLLKGQELASTFSFLRPNDLVWNYVVGNYLKGQSPPSFDLLYWNADSTNLPGPMYCWYLRNTYLENNLAQPGKLTVCGEKLDLRTLDMPAYVYASREDHIVPWQAAWRNTQVLGGAGGGRKKRPLRFVLGASGHIAGVINPPSKNKRSHWVAGSDKPAAGAEAWLEDAQERPGSWWPDWSEWLKRHAGNRVDAPSSPGSPAYPPIEPAPGRYVRQRA